MHTHTHTKTYLIIVTLSNRLESFFKINFSTKKKRIDITLDNSNLIL